MTRGPLRRRSAVLPLLAALLTFLLTTGVSDATYTGGVELTTFGAAAAGAGVIAVPEFIEQSDPGTITGTPYHSTFASLSVARVIGPRRIAFGSTSGALSTATEMPLAAASPRAVVTAWTTGTQIGTATLSTGGALTRVASTPGNPIGPSLRLTVGPDGAYAIQWTDAAGGHAEAVPAAASSFEQVLAGGATVPAGDSVVLAGGDAAWLMGRDANGVDAAPITLGQSTAPAPVPVLPGVATTALADDVGNLWILGRELARWWVARLDRAGHLTTFTLRRGASGALMALAPGHALVSYRGPNCHTYLQPVAEGATKVGSALDLTTGAPGCSAPAGLVADPVTGTAFVVVRSGRAGRLVVARRLAITTSAERLSGLVVAVQALGSGRLLVETEGPVRDIGEQCGGAADSYATTDSFRVFDGARVLRTGSLVAQDIHC